MVFHSSEPDQTASPANDPPEYTQEVPGEDNKIRRSLRKGAAQRVPTKDEPGPVRNRENSKVPREKDDPGLYRVVAIGGVELERKSASSLLDKGRIDTLPRDSLIHIGEVTIAPESRRVSGHVTGVVGSQEEVSGWIPLLDLESGFSWANKVSIKEQVKMTLQKPVYDVRNFYWTTGIWQALARNNIFENVTLGVISFNALWIAIDTDNNKAGTLLEADPVFQIAEHSFCVYFSFEWTVRFLAFKYKRNCLRDMWFMFDSFLVLLMVMETWIMTIASFFSTGSTGMSGGQASLLRLLRLLRLSRLARMLRSMPELLILIKGITAAMRSVFFTVLLLVIIMYIVAIIFRQLTDGTDVGDALFSSVLVAMARLTTTGAFCDNYNDTVDAIGDDLSWTYATFFILFTLLGAYPVLGMLIGILCEVVSNVASEEKEGMLMEFVRGRMEEIMNSLDDDGSGSISKEEFRKIMHKPEAVRILEETGVDAESLVDYIDYIFEGEDDEDVELNLAGFLDLILKFRSSNTATVKDAVDMRAYVKSSFKRLEDKLQARKPPVMCAPAPRKLKELQDKAKGKRPVATLGPDASARNEIAPRRSGILDRPIPEKLPKGASDCLDRMDVFLSAALSELERMKQETGYDPVPRLPPPRQKDDVVFSNASSDSEGGASQGERKFHASFRRLERFASMGLDELQRLDAILPINFPPTDVASPSRRARMWRASMEEFYLTVGYQVLEDLSKAVHTIYEGPAGLKECLAHFSQALETRLATLRELLDAPPPALPVLPGNLGLTRTSFHPAVPLPILGPFNGAGGSGANLGRDGPLDCCDLQLPPIKDALSEPPVPPMPGTPHSGLVTRAASGTQSRPESPGVIIPGDLASLIGTPTGTARQTGAISRAGTPNSKLSGRVVPFEENLPGSAASSGGSSIVLVNNRSMPPGGGADAAAGGMVG